MKRSLRSCRLHIEQDERLSLLNGYLYISLPYCIKIRVTYSHVLTDTYQCINKAIHELLMHGLGTIDILTLGIKLETNGNTKMNTVRQKSIMYNSGN